jgi:hypothetical protein
MKKTSSIELSKKIYERLLTVYPKTYKEEYRQSMLQTFAEMSEDAGLAEVWQIILKDAILSLPREYLALIINNMRFENIKFAVIGFLFLVPMGLFIVTAMTSQALNQLMIYPNHLNDSIGQLIARYLPAAVVAFLVLPVLAVALNLAAVQRSLLQKNRASLLSGTFLHSNLFSIVIACGGLLALVFLFGHDAIPCFLQGIYHHGLKGLWPLIQVCRIA